MLYSTCIAPLLAGLEEELKLDVVKKVTAEKSSHTSSVKLYAMQKHASGLSVFVGGGGWGRKGRREGEKEAF